MFAFEANTKPKNQETANGQKQPSLIKKGERTMGKATGFMDYKREKPNERDPLTRQNDWKEYSAPYTDDVLKSRALDVWIAEHRFVKLGWRSGAACLAARSTI